MKNYKLYINNKWHDASDKKTFFSKNPATGEDIATVASANAKDVDSAINAAREAFDEGEWPKMSALERGRILFLFCSSVIVSCAISKASFLCSSQLTTDIGIFDQGTIASSSISPRSRGRDSAACGKDRPWSTRSRAVPRGLRPSR